MTKKSVGQLLDEVEPLLEDQSTDDVLQVARVMIAQTFNCVQPHGPAPAIYIMSQLRDLLRGMEAALQLNTPLMIVRPAAVPEGTLEIEQEPEEAQVPPAPTAPPGGYLH